MRVIEVERNGQVRRAKASEMEAVGLPIMGESTKIDAALRAALSTIEKQFGKDAVMLLGETERQSVEAIKTGCLGLDVALGVGGIPRGRVTEIYGTESSGKSTLAMHVVAEAQKSGGVAAYVDAEHAVDPEYAARIGVDIAEALDQPAGQWWKKRWRLSTYLVRSGAVDVVVIDLGRGARARKAEIEGEMGDSSCRPAGPFDVAGASQADGEHRPHEYSRYLHQSGAREDWRDVRESRNHPRRTRPQVLRKRSPGDEAGGEHQGRERVHGAAREGEGGQE